MFKHATNSEPSVRAGVVGDEAVAVEPCCRSPRRRGQRDLDERAAAAAAGCPAPAPPDRSFRPGLSIGLYTNMRLYCLVAKRVVSEDG